MSAAEVSVMPNATVLALLRPPERAVLFATTTVSITSLELPSV